MSETVLVIGAGRLADLVHQELVGSKHRVKRQWDLDGMATEGAAETVDVCLALFLEDGWTSSQHLRAETVFRAAGIPWLRAGVTWGQGVVGPLVLPNTPGCTQCADLRRLMAGPDRAETYALEQEMAKRESAPADVWASQNGLRQLALVVVAEVERVIRGCPPQFAGHVHLLHMKTLRMRPHRFLPDPACPVCGQVRDDSPEDAVISLEPSPKVNRTSYRCRPMADFQDVLKTDYLDAKTGLVNGTLQDLGAPFAAVTVNLPLIHGDEASAGRTHSYAESEITGIFEAIERYCGLAPRRKRTVVHSSYREVAHQALNPVTVGLHANEQYAKPNFPFQRFNPDTPLDWVWGYSLLQARPILVPELLAYYSLGCGNGFVYETSNGCAVGGSLVEAIFHGILEVVERDGFLLTWYAQLPIPRLDLGSTNDTELHLMVHRLESLTGYELHVFNATMENRIPTVWAIAKNQRSEGMNLACAAGAHLDPVRAVKSAIHELAGLLLVFDEKLATNRAKYLHMLRDPFQVQHMDDHPMIYGLPEAESRLDFLLQRHRHVQTFAEAFPKWDFHDDLTDDLRAVMAVFRRLHLDIIVVNQTSPELERNGLHCVKVIIPGMLPMTFGHHLTRLEGLNRVLHVPAELGYAGKPLKRKQLNPHPHPFA